MHRNPPDITRTFYKLQSAVLARTWTDARARNPMHDHVALPESHGGHATAHKYEHIISRVASAAVAGRLQNEYNHKPTIHTAAGPDNGGHADCAQQKQKKRGKPTSQRTPVSNAGQPQQRVAAGRAATGALVHPEGACRQGSKRRHLRQDIGTGPLGGKPTGDSRERKNRGAQLWRVRKPKQNKNQHQKAHQA